MQTPQSEHSDFERPIALWLFGLAIMVFAMVVLGGVTRLTDSGLSMVEWRPVTGWLPPFTEMEWLRIFEKYQAYPEFHKVNADMSVEEFKGIFWLEFLHRLWGRVIGIAFFVPFVYFLVKGGIRGRRMVVLGLIFILGGLQGGMGWFMVKSGLVDRPDVSQYRLAAHLILALLIYASLIWCGLEIWFGKKKADRENRPLSAYSLWVICFVFVTAFSGALVAGLDAGLSYNTFPLMDGDLIPDGLFEMQPVYLNFFENRLTVQFDHRLLAIFTFLLVMRFCYVATKAPATPEVMRPVQGLAMMICAQVMLGISTLLLAVPVFLGALHQAGALLVLGFAIWAAYEIRYPVRKLAT